MLLAADTVDEIVKRSLASHARDEELVLDHFAVPGMR
jgi:hypothetical protein